MKRQTKIICTLGPSSQTGDVILKMCQAGMDIARINFSHGDHEQHQKIIGLVRLVNKKYHFSVKILQDLEGYRIRLGRLKRPVELKPGERICLSQDPAHTRGHIPLRSDADLGGIKKGMDVFINDGMLTLKVIGRKGKKIMLEVLQGGMISSKKGVNIPELKLTETILTDKDKRDVEFGVGQKVDYVAQSFVRNRQDIIRVSKLVKPRLPDCQIIAKIENREGVKNVDSIMDACDGILIARGDLGVSLPIYQIPIIQKNIIRRCSMKKKLDITATQMLESMTGSNRPTRAEVSDVANAILDGTDCVMLSGETAAGRFPVESVKMMRQIIEFTEKAMVKL
ncbi:MAG: pyruvate kinase [Candidatus Omnitrophota bacterium]